MANTMVNFKNVTKKYPNSEVPAVKNLNFKINEGEIVVLVGPSGCGKTSTMKMINRLIEPTEGEIYIKNENIAKINPMKLRQGIGYVIQYTGLFPHLTVEQNISTVPKLKKWDKNKIKKRVTELLELVGMDPETYRDRLPGQLSGGQQQRIGLARALAADPPIMIMDEPFGALDPITRENLQNEFLNIQKNVKKTIIFVTHDIDEAVKMGDKIIVMKDGEIIQYDTPLAILSTPANQFIYNLTGEDRAIKFLSLIPISQMIKTANKQNKVPHTIEANKSLKEALIEMLEKNVTKLSVIDDNIFLGNITLNDLVEITLNKNNKTDSEVKDEKGS